MSSDMTMLDVVGALSRRAFETSRAHGFWDNQDPQNPTVAAAKIALMHSELSEALEEVRVDKGSDDGLAEELADTCIRIFDFCGARGLDLGNAILAKMRKNEARPYKHGKTI